MFKFLYEEADNREQSEKQIAHLELKYGITFPDVLRELYARVNICEPSIKHCEIEKDDDIFAVSNLVPLLPGENSQYCFEWEADVIDRDEPMNEYVQHDWYPFALDEGDATFYWNSETHQVYFVIPDDPDSLEEPDLVADSIEEFIEMMNNSVVEA